MLTEKQILTAYELKRQGRTYRQIADAVGLDGKTQHSQVVSALRYYVMGHQSAMRKMQSAMQAERSPWTGRIICFVAGFTLNIAIATIIFTM
ncbi:MAG: hypothetical protein PHT96_12635 [Syntrophorhabdaceae bacterium]|nr:hypothetical protein [Syntrophorhabdaceae bacterium]MDD4197234.1 hypothetical protein [Syntrophorhabdaceae bacterium]